MNSVYDQLNPHTCQLWKMAERKIFSKEQNTNKQPTVDPVQRGALFIFLSFSLIN